jgi:hypothetical protein
MTVRHTAQPYFGQPESYILSGLSTTHVGTTQAAQPPPPRADHRRQHSDDSEDKLTRSIRVHVVRVHRVVWQLLRELSAHDPLQLRCR